MATHAQIQCINKTNRSDPHDRIHSVGGINADKTRWKMSQEAAIKRIEDGLYDFYVNQAGHEVKVIVATNNGKKYLKTQNDGIYPNNLLALPECP